LHAYSTYTGGFRNYSVCSLRLGYFRVCQERFLDIVADMVGHLWLPGRNASWARQERWLDLADFWDEKFGPPYLAGKLAGTPEMTSYPRQERFLAYFDSQQSAESYFDVDSALNKPTLMAILPLLLAGKLARTLEMASCPRQERFLAYLDAQQPAESYFDVESALNKPTLMAILPLLLAGKLARTLEMASYPWQERFLAYLDSHQLAKSYFDIDSAQNRYID